MGEVIDLSGEFDRKKWLTSRHNQAWDLHGKYADKFQVTGNYKDLKLAQKWMESALKIGFTIDLLDDEMRDMGKIYNNVSLATDKVYNLMSEIYQ